MARRALNTPRYRVPIPGFSHVIQAPARGDLLFVSGLTSRAPDGAIVHVGDLGGQTRRVLENMRAVLAAAGATLDDVVQIRTFVRDVRRWPEIETVWAEYWGPVWPASTLVEIRRLYDPRQLIEMEAIALRPRGPGRPAARRARTAPAPRRPPARRTRGGKS